MNIQFFATRTLAREAAKESGGTFQDHGKITEPGQRWAVMDAAPVVKVEILTIPHKEFLNRAAPRVSYATGNKGEPVPVTWQRSKAGALLAHNIQLSAR